MPNDTLNVPTSIRQRIEHIADQHAATWQQFREHLHTHPELTGQEYETTRWIAEHCRRWQLEPVITDERRGLWCDLDGGENSVRVLVRGDIDALPIQTTSTAAYRSVVPSVMHACGHDVHTVCVLAAMQIVSQLRRDEDAAVRRYANEAAVRFCFQPAEEDSTGGPLMVAAGATRGCGAAVALHTDPGRAVGSIGVRWGSFTAGCDVFYATFSGEGGHGARPHLTQDCLSAAVEFVSQIQTRVPRCTDARQPLVVNVGSIHGGIAPNVVPAETKLSGTLRATDSNGRDRAIEVMRSIAESIEKTHGCRCELQFGVSNPPVINHPKISDAIAHSGDILLGENNVEVMHLPSMGAEDFAFIAAEVPAAMFRLGIQSTDGDAASRRGHRPLHTPDFDVDPQCLRVGGTILALTAMSLSHHDPIDPAHETKQRP